MKKVMALFMCLIIFCGCNEMKKSPGNREEGKKNILIVTSFYPVYISTINVTKNVPGVEVLNLTDPQTGCLHNYSLTVDNMKNISRADILIINGAGMETFVDKIKGENHNIKLIDSSKDVILLKKIGTEEYNPHIWVSISNSIKQVGNIEKELSEYDPSNKELYKKNGNLYIKKLEELKNEIKEGTKNIKNKNIITFHEAFTYFAKEFDFNVLAVIEREPGVEPNAKEIANTVEIIKKYEITGLFSEPQYSSGPASVIATETGLNIYILDPAVTGALEEDAYINIMRSNLKMLKEALK